MIGLVLTMVVVEVELPTVDVEVASVLVLVLVLELELELAPESLLDVLLTTVWLCAAGTGVEVADDVTIVVVTETGTVVEMTTGPTSQVSLGCPAMNADSAEMTASGPAVAGSTKDTAGFKLTGAEVSVEHTPPI